MTSILPIYTGLILALVLILVLRAHRRAALSQAQAVGLYGLWGLFAAWTGLVIWLGQSQWHLAQMDNLPLLWQALVPVVIWSTGVALSKDLRQGLLQLGKDTPAHWIVSIQALRLGAIGGISKGVSGEITSGYVFWVGVPDFLFGLSALLLVVPVMRGRVGPRFLILWNLVGAGLIVLPSFLAMPYWMAEPGFAFIFEYPMVLAPSIVVSLMISLNLLLAFTVWSGLRQKQAKTRARA